MKSKKEKQEQKQEPRFNGAKHMQRYKLGIDCILQVKLVMQYSVNFSMERR
jgi:hypothetical protein